MATYSVKSYKTSAPTVAEIEAASREDAVQKTVDTAGEGEDVQVLEVTEVVAAEPAPEPVGKAE